MVQITNNHAPRRRGAWRRFPVCGVVGTTCAVPVLCVTGASCDNWNWNASNPCLYVGGNYNQNGNHGVLYVNYTTASNTNANYGSRLLFAKAKPPYTAQVAAHPIGEDQRLGSGRVPAVLNGLQARNGGALESPYC